MGLRRTDCESAAESLVEPQPVPWASAEDLVQTAMLQSWLHWDAIRTDAPELHVRRVLTNTFLSRQRRRPGQRAQLTLRVGTATRTRRQVAEAFPPGRGSSTRPDGAAAHTVHHRLLRSLGPKRRCRPVKGPKLVVGRGGQKLVSPNRGRGVQTVI
jgi:DNA-directed RNA polymerase specialized sigma24 family protein